MKIQNTGCITAQNKFCGFEQSKIQLVSTHEYLNALLAYQNSGTIIYSVLTIVSSIIVILAKIYHRVTNQLDLNVGDNIYNYQKMRYYELMEKINKRLKKEAEENSKYLVDEYNLLFIDQSRLMNLNKNNQDCDLFLPAIFTKKNKSKNLIKKSKKSNNSIKNLKNIGSFEDINKIILKNNNGFKKVDIQDKIVSKPKTNKARAIGSLSAGHSLMINDLSADSRTESTTNQSPICDDSAANTFYFQTLSPYESKMYSQYFDQNSNSFFAPVIYECNIYLSLILLLLLTIVIIFKRIQNRDQRKNSNKINEYDLLFQDQQNALQQYSYLKNNYLVKIIYILFIE
uniref:Transmembrane protein n=1 Tax=Avrainvillea sp. HV04061 TaxID=2364086 RepID=A0A3B8D8U9_9CHLO|nr:hypothetical protein [Avrainvillea sp. HV04061]